MTHLKRHQLHFYLTKTLAALLKEKADTYGLTPAQYVKFILVKDLNAHLVDFNIKPATKENTYINGNTKILIPEKQDLH